MEFSAFGYQLKKSGPEPKKLTSPVAPTLDDGATINSGAAYYSTVLDLDGIIKGENDLIRRYRECAMYSDVDSAIEDIVNEAISSEDDEVAVKVELDDVKIGDGIKKKIEEEFDNITTLLKFNERSHEIFRQWYIDGRIYYNILIDKDKSKEGIKELRFVDPRKIRKIKTIQKKKSEQGVDLVTVVDEYYLFNDKGVSESSTVGVKMSIDSVVYVPSGNFDANTGMALSFLNKAVKPTNQLKMLEDAMVIYRITRAPERRIFYIDVGNLPKQKAEQYVTDMMNKFKNKIVYDANTGEVRDDRKHMCLSMDTKVPLLDGRTLSIEQIAIEYNAGKQLWAYSCNPITGGFAPGLITWAGVARKDAKVMKLTLDNGETITCTHDHKFPVWGKGNIEARDLIVGESMIPHYVKQKQIQGKIGKGNSYYEQLFKNDTKNWEFTHRLVSRWKDSNSIENEMTFDASHSDLEKRTVHHKNCHKDDNTPDNLVRMNNEDHTKLHHKIGTSVAAYRTANNIPHFINVTKEMLQELGRKNGKINGPKAGKYLFENKLGMFSPEGENVRKDALESLFSDPIWYAAFCLNQKNNWNEINKAVMSDFAKSFDLSGKGNAAQKILWKTTEHKAKHTKKYKTEYSAEQYASLDFCASQKMTVKEATIYINENNDIEKWIELNKTKVGTQKTWKLGIASNDIARMVNNLGLQNWQQYQTALEFRNHKIAKIEYLDETMDVGCLTIDGKENHHNFHTFALSAGIYTQNSMMEDFWMPRREGGKGTEITTLPGLQNTNNTEDVAYFQTKLFQALNVPVSRNQQGGIFNAGRGSEITRDEIKFAKFVSRLRTKFSNLFLELLRMQLLMKEIITLKDWPNIASTLKFKYAKDNHFAEFKNNEIMTQRVNLLMLMDPLVAKYYSVPWIRKNVLMQSDEDMKEMDKEREKEAAANPMPQDEQSPAPQAQEQPQ